MSDGASAASSDGAPGGVLSGEALARCERWLPADDEIDRPRIQLSTVDIDGAPDVRTVLLSGWTPAGFSFHTDSRSRKAMEIGRDPRVALLVLWPGFSRQLVIRGRAMPEEPAVSAAAYSRRSPYLKQLAWQNDERFAQLERPERIAEWSAFAGAHRAEDLIAPPSWIGFQVQPTRLTFWESDAESASRRVEYLLMDGRWRSHRLPG